MRRVPLKHNFVLVHGAWHGGWCWERVIPLLQAQGAAVVAPVLSGVGERASQLDGSIDLDTHADDVIDAIEQAAMSDVFLVGHSYAGAVITAVADRRPDLLAHLVYLDALIVEHGESLASRWLSEAEHQALAADHLAGRVGKPPLPLEIFDVAEEEDVDWVRSRLTLHPSGTYLQPLELENPFGNGLAKTFLFCTRTASPMIGTLRTRLPGPESEWSIRDLAAGHDIMVTNGALLADCLTAIATSHDERGQEPCRSPHDRR